MSEEVKNAIAAELATLTQTVDFPVEPFGYGSDISCAQDVDPLVREVDAFTTLALAEALVRRLDTPRGSLPDDKDYGIDLRGLLNKGSVASDIQQLAGQVRAELAKDDRVDTLTVTVAPSSTGTVLRLEVAVQPVDAELGPFTLTLSASSASVLLEEIRSAL